MRLQAKPFIKWAGGKGQLLNTIRGKYPSEMGGQIDKYAEPFVGGGAVLFDVLNTYCLREVYISDVNRELIHTYMVIRDNAEALISLLSDMECKYNAPNVDRTILYYSARANFNKLKVADCLDIELAALFIFLNRTCFNGLYRVNRRGEYNVPKGQYTKPTICDADNLRAVSKTLNGVKIICGDYRLSRDFIDDNTFAYFDPPYRPLTTTASFTAYAESGFGDKEQTELAQFIDEMSERGAWVVASNSDPKNVDKNDDFFDRLYAKHSVFRIEANRAINSVGNGRGRVKELLIARGEGF